MPSGFEQWAAGPIPGLIGEGLGIIGNIWNAANQGRQNRINKKWQENMYAMQRRDALSDWAMMNAYNSPAAQMQRYKEAGLNPNLIYGQSNNGAVVRSSDAPGQNAPAGRVDTSNIGKSLAMGYAMQGQIAQTDNLKAQLEVLQQERDLKNAQTANMLVDTASKATDIETKKFYLERAKALYPGELTHQENELRIQEETISKIYYEYQVSLREDARRAALTAQSLDKGIKEMLLIGAQTAKTEQERENLKKMNRYIEEQTTNEWYQNQLNSMEMEARKNGWTWRDGAIQRMIQKFFSDLDATMSKKPFSKENPKK